MERDFVEQLKAFFIIFKGLSIAKNCLRCDRYKKIYFKVKEILDVNVS